MSKIYPASTGQVLESDPNSCAVRALANVACLSYGEAYNLFKQAGRQHGKGTPWTICQRVYKDTGATFLGSYGTTRAALGAKYAATQVGDYTTENPGMSIAKWIERHQRGRYIVGVSGHVLAVIDGQTVDTFALPKGKRVVKAWKFP